MFMANGPANILGTLLGLMGVAAAQTPVATPKSAAPSPSINSMNDELTLNECLALGLRQNGDTLAAARSFAASRADVQAARSGFFPQVGGSVNYGYSDRSGTVSTLNNSGNGVGNGVGGSNSSSFSTRSGTTTTDVNVTQNLFDGGRVKTRVAQAQAGALGAVASLGSARSALAFEIAQRFYNQLRQNRLVTQREGQVALSGRQLELVQAQFKAGSVARSDIQSVLVTVSQAQLDLSTARNDQRIAQTNLRNSLGLSRGPALRLRDELPVVPFQTASISIANGAAIPETVTVEQAEKTLGNLESYVALADRLRPDVLRARSDVESARASVKLAKIDAKPQITASAGYSLDPRDTRTRGFTFSTGLSIPLFDAGGRKAGVRAGENNFGAAQITLEQVRKDVAADVETAYIDILGQAERFSNARTLVEQARVNLENASAKYRAGAGIILDIVNAQTQLFNAQNSYTGTLYDAQTARLNLDRAVGRFAWADPQNPAPNAAPDTLLGATDTVSRLAIPMKQTPPASLSLPR